MDHRPNKIVALARSEGKPVREIIVNAIVQAGSATGGARVLGVNSNTMRYWMKKLGIKVTVSQSAKVEVQS